MFGHIFKYEIKNVLRAKDFIFWLIFFPIILGTLFKIVLYDIYNKQTKFSTVPAAVVENVDDPIFRQVIAAVEEGDEPLLKVTYTDENTALDMLEKGEVEGIIYVGDKLTLSVAGQGMNETILKAFTEQYMMEEKIITDAVTKNPLKARAVIDALSEEVSACTRVPVTEGDTNTYTAYFYNLIAMVALCGSITGLHITVQNQANLSDIGARKNIAPTKKSVNLLACLLGSFLAQGACMIIAVTFIQFVLGVDFGSRLPMVYLTALLGGTVGVSIGFFVGSVSGLKAETKHSLTMAGSLFLCFLSGLMAGNMKQILNEKAPIVNKLNPAAVICDSFYCLNIYSDLSRYSEKVITMAITTVLFTALGFILSGRQRYEAL